MFIKFDVNLHPTQLFFTNVVKSVFVHQNVNKRPLDIARNKQKCNYEFKK